MNPGFPLIKGTKKQKKYARKEKMKYDLSDGDASLVSSDELAGTSEVVVGLVQPPTQI